MRSIIIPLTAAIVHCLLVARSTCAAPGRLNTIDDSYSDDNNRRIDTTTIPTTTDHDGSYTSEYESEQGSEHESERGSEQGSEQGSDRYSDGDGMEAILEKLEYHVGRLSEAEPVIKDRYTFTDGTGRSVTVEYAVGLSPLPPGTIR